MRHSVHLMFGKEFSKSLSELKKYIMKYGEKEVSPYFNTLLWEQNPEGDVILSSVQARVPKENDAFVSGLQNLYEVELRPEAHFPANEQKIHVADYFDNLFRSTITINNPGDSNLLHLCLYIPLYDRKVWEQAQLLIDTVMSLSISYQVDIFGLAADTAFLFTPEENKESLPMLKAEYSTIAASVIHDIVAYKKENQGYISNFVILQNCQRDGLALNLDIDSYTRIIGEFALLCIEHYHDVFITIPTEESPIRGLGLAVLNFDKYYFVQYLLRRTYLYIMDKEKVTDKKVDINRAAQITQAKLKDKTKLVSTFYDTQVVPLLDQQINQDKIIADVTPKLDALMDDIGKDLQSFISDPTLSLPEKRATLATLLGMDDVLLTGYAFNQEQLVIDDLEQEATQIFVDANNNVKPADEPGILSGVEDAYLPFKEIKDLRAKMRQATTYIREKEEQLKKIEGQKKDSKRADKRLTEDGYFIYEGHKYRLQPTSVKEQPLEDTYKPIANKAGSIDLRAGFTSVKNQGVQGSCTAFTMAAIYEYILKSNNATESDLSEAFLYYNARKRVGKESEDCGSNFFDTTSSLSEQGICTEKNFSYHEDIYNMAPPPDAYADASSRVVKKAVNVKPQLDDIRSALSEGYPVAISLKIFDSFLADSSGFVSRPTSKEMKAANSGNHAMVICGYSDEKKFFIVRNSWGTSFGQSGYCYIPYSYIGDKELLNMACIITEVGSEYKVGGVDNKVQLFFDTTDANIQYAITKNLVDEEKYYLQRLVKQDTFYREAYYTLVEKISNNGLRNNLIASSEVQLRDTIDNYKLKKAEAMSEKNKQLQEFDTLTRKTGINIICLIIGLWLGIGVAVYYTSVYDVFSISEAWYIVLGSFLLVGLLFLYFPYRKRKRRFLKEYLESVVTEWAVKIDKTQRQLSQTRLRMHIAGMIHDRLFALRSQLLNKYHVMKSFTGNLVAWYKDEEEMVEHMDSSTKDPFISLLSNDVLDRYFELHKEDIASGIKLYSFVDSYEITEEGIQKFKEDVKNSVIKGILSLIDDFKIFAHIAQDKEYAYLDREYADINKLLPILDKKSRIFMQLTSDAMADNPHKVVFIHTEEQREKNYWNQTYPAMFNIPPASKELKSKFKILVVRMMNLELSQIMIAGRRR